MLNFSDGQINDILFFLKSVLPDNQFVLDLSLKDLNGHSLIRGVLIQSCSAGAKNFTNYVFCHPQFSGVIQNIENYRAILTLIVYANYY